ncbi:hypothetical protein [Streptomyces halobius]|uniref:Uncharacterized protein n=1 Tax=Streptomyces halobius TaxID=2879846 RepID=A0ABY4MII2_9ACTN|nr:hypothetical protein [Streptomyces halobius]UQA97368.1 hypothetical protein K9S39_40840 [Streptomyces halobius]
MNGTTTRNSSPEVLAPVQVIGAGSSTPATVGSSLHDRAGAGRVPSADGVARVEDLEKRPPKSKPVDRVHRSWLRAKKNPNAWGDFTYCATFG